MMSWLPPASGGFHREKPNFSRSAWVQLPAKLPSSRSHVDRHLRRQVAQRLLGRRGERGEGLLGVALHALLVERDLGRRDGAHTSRAAQQTGQMPSIEAEAILDALDDAQRVGSFGVAGVEPAALGMPVEWAPSAMAIRRSRVRKRSMPS